MEWAGLVVHLLCGAALLLQLTTLLHSLLSPTLTHTTMEEVRLEDLPIPLSIRLCIKPSFDTLALEELGYADVYNYFLGRSRYNKTVIGWAGHSNINYTVEEVLRRVRAHTVDQVVKQVRLVTKDGSFVNISLDLLTQKRVNYPHNCYTLDMTGWKGGFNGMEIMFHDEISQSSVDFEAVGSSLAVDRTILSSTFRSSGAVQIGNISNTWNQLVVNVRKNVYMEEDTSKKCRNYPTKEHATYRECDAVFVRREVERVSPGLVPVWATDNMGLVTTLANANITG